MADATPTNQNAAAAGTDGQSGSATLDQLLAEFKAGTTGTNTNPTPAIEATKVIEAMRPALEYVEQDRIQKQTEAVQKSIDDAIKFVKGDDDGLKGVSDVVVDAILHRQYARDAGFKSAYDNRAKDPKAWENAQVAVRSQIKTELKLANGGGASRSDVEAATAAVRGQRSPALDSTGKEIDPAKLSRMSDTEFADFKRTLGR